MIYRYVKYLLEEDSTGTECDHGPMGGARIGSLSAILMLLGDSRKVQPASGLMLVKSKLHECGFHTSHFGFLHAPWLSHVGE